MADLVEMPSSLKRTKFINISSNKEIHTSKEDTVLETRPIIKDVLGETESLSRQEILALETFPVYRSKNPELGER